MSRASRDSFEPERLLEASNSNLATRLLRSAAAERPRPASLAKALSAVSLAASATALSASSAAAGGLAKTVATWLLLGGLGGTVVSASLLQLTRTEAPAAGMSRARPSAGKDAFRASRTALTQPSPSPPSQETPTASASPVDLERPRPSTALPQRAVRPTPLGSAPRARTSITAGAPAVAQTEAGLAQVEPAAPAPGAANDQGRVAAGPAAGTPSGALGRHERWDPYPPLHHRPSLKSFQSSTRHDGAWRAATRRGRSGASRATRAHFRQVSFAPRPWRSRSKHGLSRATCSALVGLRNTSCNTIRGTRWRRASAR
jgi:hypothetical protein